MGSTHSNFCKYALPWLVKKTFEIDYFWLVSPLFLLDSWSLWLAHALHLYVSCLILTSSSLNPLPNAQVCVFDGTYYKITTTNYIFKTSLYTTFHMYTWGPWPLKILMFALLVTHEIATYSWPWERPEMANICWVCCWSKSWGCPPPPGLACLS
jgi:hypothetical protein